MPDTDFAKDIEALITETLAQDNEIVAAAIYGSWAKNELHSESDIDILILGTQKIRWDKVRALLDQIEPFVGREVNFAGYSAADFLGRGISPYGFLNRILSGPLINLLGDVRSMRPAYRSKDFVPRVARDRGIKHGGHHRGIRYPK